jgi:hypothetical protein
MNRYVVQLCKSKLLLAESVRQDPLLLHVRRWWVFTAAPDIEVVTRPLWFTVCERLQNEGTNGK